MTSRRILPTVSAKQPPDPQWDQPPHIKLDQAKMIHQASILHLVLQLRELDRTLISLSGCLSYGQRTLISLSGCLNYGQKVGPQ